jgi:hypothetical protein
LWQHWCSTRFDTAGQCVWHVKHCFLSTFCWPDNHPSWHPYYIDWLSSSELAVAAFYYLKTWFFPSKLRSQYLRRMHWARTSTIESSTVLMMVLILLLPFPTTWSQNGTSDSSLLSRSLRHSSLSCYACIVLLYLDSLAALCPLCLTRVFTSWIMGGCCCTTLLTCFLPSCSIGVTTITELMCPWACQAASRVHTTH